MRLGLVCLALCCWAPVAAAQISFVHRTDADDEIASRLQELIGQRVQVVAPEFAVLAKRESADSSAAIVSIDREDSVVRVVSNANPEGFSRAFDEDVMEESPYAVALAAAELLDWLDVISRDGGTAPGFAARSGAPSFALGLDLEVQSQLASDLTFARPALAGELAWGRGTPGLFWTAGARVSAPLARELQPSATGSAADARLRAQAMDAALQIVGGYSFGRLGLTAHLAAGVAYLRVSARDADRRELGSDTQFSPLCAAGLGARFSVALGFALGLRGEAQWAGPRSIYRVGGEPVLDRGAFRVGLLAGILWETALASGAR
jgi:hypothetical protein